MHVISEAQQTFMCCVPFSYTDILDFDACGKPEEIESEI